MRDIIFPVWFRSNSEGHDELFIRGTNPAGEAPPVRGVLALFTSRELATAHASAVFERPRLHECESPEELRTLLIAAQEQGATDAILDPPERFSGERLLRIPELLS